MTKLFTDKPFPVIIKNYFEDGWKVVNYYSASKEETLFECGTWEEAKRFCDAERAKRGT